MYLCIHCGFSWYTGPDSMISYLVLDRLYNNSYLHHSLCLWFFPQSVQVTPIMSESILLCSLLDVPVLSTITLQWTDSSAISQHAAFVTLNSEAQCVAAKCLMKRQSKQSVTRRTSVLKTPLAVGAPLVTTLRSLYRSLQYQLKTVYQFQQHRYTSDRQHGTAWHYIE